MAPRASPVLAVDGSTRVGMPLRCYHLHPAETLVPERAGWGHKQWAVGATTGAAQEIGRVCRTSQLDVGPDGPTKSVEIGSAGVRNSHIVYPSEEEWGRGIY